MSSPSSLSPKIERQVECLTEATMQGTSVVQEVLTSLFCVRCQEP